MNDQGTDHLSLTKRDPLDKDQEPRRVSEKTQLKYETKYLRREIRKVQSIIRARDKVSKLREDLESLRRSAGLSDR